MQVILDIGSPALNLDIRWRNSQPRPRTLSNVIAAISAAIGVSRVLYLEVKTAILASATVILVACRKAGLTALSPTVHQAGGSRSEVSVITSHIADQ